MSEEPVINNQNSNTTSPVSSFDSTTTSTNSADALKKITEHPLVKKFMEIMEKLINMIPGMKDEPKK